VYYRVWIFHFVIIAEPLYALLRKNVIWAWIAIYDKSMDCLKEALSSPPALISLDYSEYTSLIVLTVNASGEGWGGVII